MSTALHRLDIAALRAALRDGLTARHVTDAMLDRTAALNPSLHLLVELWPEAARLRAEALDRAGTGHTPLWGVPLAHKDIFARQHRQPSCGVADATGMAPLPPAPVLELLERAGGVELGVVNLAEFALGTTGTNAFFGNVGNPWNVAHCSGASSSGSAALVAAGVAWGSLGTDSGASCRVPASFCGVVGFMPTHGALSTEGVFPLAWSLDTVGLLARSVKDCEILFAALHTAPPAPRARAVIGVPKRYYGEHAVPEVLAAWHDAARVLEAAGHRVIEVDVIETPEIRTLTRLIMRTEAAAVHRQAMQIRPQNYPLAVRKFITGGEGLLAVDYVDALRLRAVLLRQALAVNFAEADVLLTPTCPVLPPRYDAIDNPADAAAWRVVALLAHCTQPASYLGLPAVSVPFALSPAGLPIGVQLIARPRCETTLFMAANSLQRSWQSLAVWPECAP